MAAHHNRLSHRTSAHSKNSLAARYSSRNPENIFVEIDRHCRYIFPCHIQGAKIYGGRSTILM